MFMSRATCTRNAVLAHSGVEWHIHGEKQSDVKHVLIDSAICT
jgi:hypothetical protein